MALMDKKQIERQYNSYEEVAKAFGECTEIYLCTHLTAEEPSHYEMARRPDAREALFDSPYIKDVKLAWSKDEGAVIPFKS
jgi:hypothetical protein